MHDNRLRHGLDADAVEIALDRQSGILGVSGVSADFRQVVEAAHQGYAAAALALAVYGHRLRQGVAAMTAALGGLDALVFTGGVGENSAELREETCVRLSFLGLAIDPAANGKVIGDALISLAGGPTSVLVVRAREDLEMTREAGKLLG